MLRPYMGSMKIELVAEEFFEFGDFGVGLVEIFLGVGGVAAVEGVVTFFEEEGHALLGGDHVGSESIAGRGLLFFEPVEAFLDGVGASLEFVGVFRDAIDFFIGGAGAWRRHGSAGRLLCYRGLRCGAGCGFGCGCGFAAADFYGCAAAGDGS